MYQPPALHDCESRILYLLLRIAVITNRLTTLIKIRDEIAVELTF